MSANGRTRPVASSMPKVWRQSRNHLTSPPKAFGVDPPAQSCHRSLNPCRLCIRSDGRRSWLWKSDARAGKLALGTCKGSQILCEAGLLPGALVHKRYPRFVCEMVTTRVEVVNSPSHTLPGRDALAITGRPRRRLLLHRRENGPNREHEESCTRCPHKLSGTYRFS